MDDVTLPCSYDPCTSVADTIKCLQGKRPWPCVIIWQRHWVTSDDWHPNFLRNTVRITAYAYATGMLRVHIAGADDTRMERDTEGTMESLPERAQALVYWLEHRLRNPITQEWLISQGFKRA